MDSQTLVGQFKPQFLHALAAPYPTLYRPKGPLSTFRSAPTLEIVKFALGLRPNFHTHPADVASILQILTKLGREEGRKTLTYFEIPKSKPNKIQIISLKVRRWGKLVFFVPQKLPQFRNVFTSFLNFPSFFNFLLEKLNFSRP